MLETLAMNKSVSINSIALSSNEGKYPIPLRLQQMTFFGCYAYSRPLRQHSCQFKPPKRFLPLPNRSCFSVSDP